MKDAENPMKDNYRAVLQYDPEGYWVAENPELPGCLADGATAQEALSSLEISRKLWMESRLASGLDVPQPQAPPQKPTKRQTEGRAKRQKIRRDQLEREAENRRKLLAGLSPEARKLAIREFVNLGLTQ